MVGSRVLNKGDTVGTVQGRKQEHSYQSYTEMIWGQETQRLERAWFWNDAKPKAKRTQRLDDVHCAAKKLKLYLSGSREPQELLRQGLNASGVFLITNWQLSQLEQRGERAGLGLGSDRVGAHTKICGRTF